MIDANSRYYRSERAAYAPSGADGITVDAAPDGAIATYGAPDGDAIPYLKRRLLPRGNSLDVMTVVQVALGQRLDLLAARLQGDPTQFWRIADANNAMNPFDLMRPPRPLRVPRPGQ